MSTCSECGWRGVPTLSGRKVAYRGHDPEFGHVWIGAGEIVPRCPRCGADTEQDPE